MDLGVENEGGVMADVTDVPSVEELVLANSMQNVERILAASEDLGNVERAR